jgi:hypothetical protein
MARSVVVMLVHGDLRRGVQDVSDKQQIKQQELTAEEIAQEQADTLPDREEMSLVNANVAAPINAAIAANVLSDNSTATADATQVAPITEDNT